MMAPVSRGVLVIVSSPSGAGRGAFCCPASSQPAENRLEQAAMTDLSTLESDLAGQIASIDTLESFMTDFKRRYENNAVN